MTTKTYLILWDAGCGYEYDVVHAKDKLTAVGRAYDEWREAVEREASYGAVLATRENLEDAGFDPDEYLIEEDK